jgi:hypothetical protein
MIKAAKVSVFTLSTSDRRFLQRNNTNMILLEPTRNTAMGT